jgi:NAD-dependent dihydropyrimidine dehydrogenase PreA subunit
MIELLLNDRCTACNICVQVCPTNVFDAVTAGKPRIARQEDCQTCFMCELYCPADALYVAPNCHGPEAVDAAGIVASGWLGRYRRDSGWGESRGDPSHANESWRMDEVFARARAAAAQGGTTPG